MKALKVVCCILFILPILPTSAKSQADDEIVIMPLGDSMMNDGRSRGGLWNRLVDDGFILDYVGSQYQNGIIPDPNHEGVGGATIQDVADKINGLLQTYQPEFIVLMIGTNDMAGYFEETGEEAAERHDALVQQIFDNSPDEEMGMLVSNIPPVTSNILQNGPMAGEDRVDYVEAYNIHLKANMEARINAGQNLVFADVYTPMKEDTAAYLFDGVHPNGEGYEVIAEVWYEAFLELLAKNGITVANDELDSPQIFQLHQNYPNPFNPETIISYQLSGSSKIWLEIFDMSGRKVTTLIDGETKSIGSYFESWNAEGMASGIYYYRLKTPEEMMTRKMTLIK